jgi:Leucine-rich repeat (LRR) protein
VVSDIIVSKQIRGTLINKIESYNLNRYQGVDKMYGYKKKLIALMLCMIMTIAAMTASVEPVAAVEDNTLTNNSGSELHAFYDSRTTYDPQIEKYIDSLDSISFAWSRIDGIAPESMNIVKGQNQNYSFYYPEDYQQPLRYAKSKGKSIQLNIFMKGSDCTLLLPYADKRSVVINTIITYIQKDAVEGEGIYFDGIVIDFESLRDTDSTGKALLYEGMPISTYFIQFLTDLKTQLASINKKLFVAVNPRLYYDGYDYKSILGIADRVILMAHDYEPSENLRKDQVMQYTGYDALKPVDGLAPIRRVRQALEDIKSCAADQGEISKIWLQICFDSAQWKYEVNGFDGWNKLADSTLNIGDRQTPLYKFIKARLDNEDGIGQNISYSYNNELQSPFMQYFNTGDNTWNIVLYEDSKSIGAKIDLAKSYGLGGISVWSLGNIPDFNDELGVKYRLDCWNTVLSKVRSPYTAPADSKLNVKFTDKALEKAVRDKLGIPTATVTVYDVKGIYRLKLTAGVKSLSDLKYLTNLEYLDAQSLSIANISPLSSLTNLRVLYLQRNIITDISPLKKLTNLQILSLNGNRISDIRPLAPLKQLQKLFLRENKITNVSSLSGLTNLTTLHLGINAITDISPLAGLKNIQILSLDSNKIANINALTGLKYLKSLNISINKITDIKALKGLENLEVFDARKNNITNITYLKDITSLKELYLSGNKIKDYKPLSQLVILLTKYDFKI